ncbi:MAG TPA: ribbon-helix-helix protein, CopG family, partial [Armatimonadota bacterium]|nr:ribbon-helix-helix protein, CopG family [Armatimonadota bacterium]
MAYPASCHRGRKQVVNGVERFGVSMAPDLLSRFDEVIAARGYTNRSEAIRDLIRDYLVAEDW